MGRSISRVPIWLRHLGAVKEELRGAAFPKTAGKPRSPWLRVSGTDPRIASVKDAILSPEAPPRAVRALPGPLPLWFPPLAGAALGAVFLLAAAAKGADPNAFVEQVESYRIVTGAGAR